MLRALVEHGITPDLVLGTSIGAINGAVYAARPDLDTMGQLQEVWENLDSNGIFGGSMLRRMSTLVRTGTHLHDAEVLRRMLGERLPFRHLEDLALPFQCVAASIERAAEHWFTGGSIVDAVLASSALPGVLPPVEVDGEHFFDGGLVNSIPMGRAIELGARTVYVLQVGRLESKLTPPRWPWEVGFVAFEIARRHRYVSDLASVPDTVTVHVLPTGIATQPRYSDLSNLRYRDTSRVRQRIEAAHRASHDYLAALVPPVAPGDTVAGG